MAVVVEPSSGAQLERYLGLGVGIYISQCRQYRMNQGRNEIMHGWRMDDALWKRGTSGQRNIRDETRRSETRRDGTRRDETRDKKTSPRDNIDTRRQRDWRPIDNGNNSRIGERRFDVERERSTFTTRIVESNAETG